MPTAKAPSPALDPATLARMQGASYLHADAQGDDDGEFVGARRPGSGLDDALVQRGRDLAHPDAHTVATLGLAGAIGLLHSLAACLGMRGSFCSRVR